MKLYRILSWLFLIVSPIVITYIYFFSKQSVSISLHFGGITLSMIITLTTYKRFQEWLIIKKTAKETADNLGKASHSYPFLLVNVMTYLYYAMPFAITLWLSHLIKNYDGKIEMPIIFILISFAVSLVLRYIADVVRQKQIAEEELEKQESDNDKLAELIKSKL